MRRATINAIESLERRVLWSAGDGVGVDVVLDVNPGDGTANLPTLDIETVLENSAGMTLIWEHGGQTILKTDDGKLYKLPLVKADGSVSITGTDEADLISVERVDSLPAADPDILQQGYFGHGDGTPGISLYPVNDPARYERLIPAYTRSVATMEKRLAELQDSDAPAEEITEAKRHVANATKSLADARNTVARLDAGGVSFIRYRLEGVYDIYVEVTGDETAATRIRIDAAGGNDIVAVANNVPLKASLGGGTGADKITSGRKRSNLYGGGGADRLFNRSQHGGTLDGGKGADKYYNRYGEVQVIARKDGDCLVVDGSPVRVTRAGTFGVTPVTPAGSPAAGRCYFIAEGDESQTDLLA